MDRSIKCGPNSNQIDVLTPTTSRIHQAASGFRCPAMDVGGKDDDEEDGLTGSPGWREEQDLYAIAASAYTLLHGEAPPKGWPEKQEEGEGPRRRGAAKRRWRLRRYWDGETWAAVFDGLVDGGGSVDGVVPSSTQEVSGRPHSHPHPVNTSMILNTHGTV